MTEQSVINFGIIDSLVSKHFALSEKSLSMFREVLHNRDKKLKYIDEQFHSLLDEDLRAYFPVKTEIKETLDDGWSMFTNLFDNFIDNSGIEVTYDNYANNKIVIDKNEAKLFKYIKKWYLERSEMERLKFGERVSCNIDGFDYHSHTDFDLAFKRASEKIGTMKLPDKDLKVVLSFNFADWFLVSTAENWSSCLNLESDYDACYWSGLPGLITDPNRMLFYVTDGKTKNYRDIVINKSITRTWGLLNSQNIVFPVRHYPQQIISDKAISTLFPFEVYPGSLNMNNRSFGQAKHTFDDFLTNYLNESVYIYQDDTCFDLCSKKVYINAGGSGYHKIIVDGDRLSLDGDTSYDFCGGLSELIDSGKSLAECEDSGCECCNCGESYSEDDMYWADNGHYCSSCYNDMYSSCEGCGDSISNDDACFTPSGEPYCEHCFHQNYFYCAQCGEVFTNDEARSHNGTDYCDSCFNDKFVVCEECEDSFRIRITPIKYKIEKDGKILCNSCHEQLHKDLECEDCGKIIGEGNVMDSQMLDTKLYCGECSNNHSINTQGAA